VKEKKKEGVKKRREGRKKYEEKRKEKKLKKGKGIKRWKFFFLSFLNSFFSFY
jgi:hypothetical protein